MNEIQKTRLYALTSIACIAWLVQTIAEALQDGTMWTPANLIFCVCILIAISYMGYSAVTGWMNARGTDEDEDTEKS